MSASRSTLERARRSIWCAVILAAAICTEAEAATTYHVRITPGGRMAGSAEFVLDLVSDTTAPDSLQILNVTNDGTRVSLQSSSESLFEGGPVGGDLFTAVSPAPYTQMKNGNVRNTITIPFDTLGTSIAFTLTVPQLTPGAIGDQVAMFCYKRDGSYMFSTADPLGVNALFALGVTNTAGGDLNVFSPMTFVAPDTLALDMTNVGVAPAEHVAERLQFRSVAPNPSGSGFSLAIDAPAPGGVLRVRVYDVAGRLVAEPFHHAVLAGPMTVRWNGRRSDAHRLAAGVYLICAELSGQTVVRRGVLVR